MTKRPAVTAKTRLAATDMDKKRKAMMPARNKPLAAAGTPMKAAQVAKAKEMAGDKSRTVTRTVTVTKKGNPTASAGVKITGPHSAISKFPSKMTEDVFRMKNKGYGKL